MIDPFTNEIFSWLGDGNGSLKDGNAMSSQFNEPSGCYSLWIKDKNNNDKLLVFVADCNNHWIRSVEYDEGDVSTLEITKIPANKAITDVGSDDEINNDEGLDIKKNSKMVVEWSGNVCYPKF